MLGMVHFWRFITTISVEQAERLSQSRHKIASKVIFNGSSMFIIMSKVTTGDQLTFELSGSL